MTPFEIAMASLAIGFGSAALTLLGIIANILRDSLREFRKELHCISRKVDIVAQTVGVDLLELQRQAEEKET